MIDFNKRQITGKSGKLYNISPEGLPVARWNEFLLQGSTLAWNADFSTLLNSWKQVLKLATDGNNILKNLSEIVTIARKAVSGIADFANNQPPKVIKYAALFCNTEEEDLAVYDEQLIRTKYEDWKHIPIKDFFLLSSEVTPFLTMNLKESHDPKRTEKAKN